MQLTPPMAAAVTAAHRGLAGGPVPRRADREREIRSKATTITGDDRYVADYLYRESLVQLARGRPAVPAAYRGPGSAVCPARATPSSGDRRRHAAAPRSSRPSSLFVIPLDRRREWYRYHALFREFLLGELQRVEPEIVPKLHLRAADWYESNGSPRLARRAPVEDGRAGPMRPVGDLVGLAHLQRRTDVDRGAVDLVRSATPASRAYPPLAVLAGWIAVLTGQTDRGRAMGGGRRRGVVGPGPAGRHRRRSTRPGPCCAPSCARPVPSR